MGYVGLFKVFLFFSLWRISYIELFINHTFDSTQKKSEKDFYIKFKYLILLHFLEFFLRAISKKQFGQYLIWLT